MQGGCIARAPNQEELARAIECPQARDLHATPCHAHAQAQVDDPTRLGMQPLPPELARQAAPRTLVHLLGDAEDEARVLEMRRAADEERSDAVA